MEPLSNFNIDETVVTLPLSRHGDLSYTTSIKYEIHGDPSQSLSVTEVVFNPGETEKEIAITLKADHQSNDNLSLIVTLFDGRVSDSVGVPVNIGSNPAVIVVQNRVYRGPFFPNLPTITNEGEITSVLGDTQTLYYDLPLVCITVSPNRTVWHTHMLVHIHTHVLTHTYTFFFSFTAML